MAPDDWTPADDDALRSALSPVDAEGEAVVLADPVVVRARGDRIRRRRTRAWTVAAAAVVVAVAGFGFAVVGRADDRTAPPPLPATRTSSVATATPTPTPSEMPTPSPTATPTPTPTASATTPVVPGTDVIGTDGSLGPFRVGMNRSQLQAAITSAGLSGSVRIEQHDLGGAGPRDVLVQDGVDTGFGSLGLIGSFRDGSLEVLFAPSTARILGVGVGDPVSAFERAFPGRLVHDAESRVDVLTLENGVRLQLGSPVAYNDPAAVRSITILPPGDGLFSEFG